MPSSERQSHDNLIDDQPRLAPARSTPPARRAYGSERRPCPSLSRSRAVARSFSWGWRAVAVRLVWFRARDFLYPPIAQIFTNGERLRRRILFLVLCVFIRLWFKNVQRLNIRAGRAHSFSQRIRLFEKICSPETSSGSAVREKILAVHPPIRDRDSFSSDQRGRVE